MSELWSPALAVVTGILTGILLGAIFFGGLWWTVRKAVTSGQPALWFFGSVLLRMAVALAGFYFVSDGRIVAQGTAAEIRASTDPFVHQFVNAEADGPVPFHYPAPPIDSLLGAEGA